MALSLSYAEAKNRNYWKKASADRGGPGGGMGSENDDRLPRAFFFPSLQPPLYAKKAAAAAEKENG